MGGHLVRSLLYFFSMLLKQNIFNETDTFLWNWLSFVSLEEFQQAIVIKLFESTQTANLVPGRAEVQGSQYMT